MSPFLRLLSTVSFLLASSSYVLASTASTTVNFTNPVTITTFGLTNYRVGVPSGELSVHLNSAPIPVVTLENDSAPSDNARWAIELLSDGHYRMHVVAFNGAVTNRSVFAEAPTLFEPQEFSITAYQDDNIFIIQPIGQEGVWNVGKSLGDQLTIQAFKAHSTQLFKIVSVMNDAGGGVPNIP